MSEIHIAIAALGFLMVGIGMAGEGDYRDAQLSVDNYCEMVEIYKRTGGGNGWPDYRGNYQEVCK